MKKNQLRKILQHADEAGIERIASLTPMTDEQTRKRLQKAVLRRTKSTDFTPEAEEAAPAKPVRRSFGTAFSAVAACLVIAGTAAGALYLRQHNAVPRLDPASQVSEPATEQASAAELTESPTEAPAASAPIDYDMTDKMGVLGKMLNTVDFYRKVSGEFVRSESAMVNGGGVVTFEVDLDAWESYTKTVRGSLTQPAEDVLQGAAPEFEALAFYDENGGLRRYAKDDKVYLLSDTEQGACYQPEPGIARDADEGPVDPQEALDFSARLRAGEEQSSSPYVRVRSAANAFAADDCINPLEELYNLLFISDFDIAGNTAYLDRDCVVLEGEISQQDVTYRMYVDKATGCVLYREMRDSSGTLVDWMRVEQIAFDEDAAPVPDALAGRTEWTAPEPTEHPDDVPALWIAWGTNSHGQTYASCGQMHIDRTVYDQLPDLIRFGDVQDEYGRILDDTFVKKTELFEVFGDDPDAEMNRLMQAYNKTETAVPVATLHIYDIEGEKVLDTVTYYDEP